MKEDIQYLYFWSWVTSFKMTFSNSTDFFYKFHSFIFLMVE